MAIAIRSLRRHEAANSIYLCFGLSLSALALGVTGAVVEVRRLFEIAERNDFSPQLIAGGFYFVAYPVVTGVLTAAALFAIGTLAWRKARRSRLS